MQEAQKKYWDIHQVEMALDAVSQAFAQVKSEPTPGEASLWAEEIDRLGPQPVLAFMRFWMSGGGQGGFLRAPRIDDARRFVDPQWMDASSAFQKLSDLVAHVGPYRVPDANEGMSPRLADAISALGGWARVCETLPAQSQEFAHRDFVKRFEDAWGRAQARSLLGHTSAPSLVAIGQSRPFIESGEAARPRLAHDHYRADTGCESYGLQASERMS